MRANRIDANQTEIVEALRKAGAEWIPTSGDPSIGFDGLVAHQGRLFVVEIKDGSKPASARRLTDRERKRKEQVEYKGVPYNVIESKEDALKLIGVLR
jgi:predicted Holliday junction resolvase-like endonuclease